ncbi:MAG: hypothetical protein JWR66_3241 [Modestobacter sp.]|nr:hypothetical protein [Modestobacter sp.]
MGRRGRKRQFDLETALVGLLVLGIALFAFTTPQVQSHEADSGPATLTTPTHEPMPESI